MKTIYFYTRAQPYFQLGNYAESPFTLDEKTYPTVEHYFQSVKFEPDDPFYAERVRRADTPAEAKRMGQCRKHPLRKDWDEYRHRRAIH